MLDEATRTLSFPYLVERGERLSARAGAFAERFHQARARDAGAAADQRELAAPKPSGTALRARRRDAEVRSFGPARARAALSNGVISLDNFDREHAFGDSDLRLLTTLAGSLSVALENARLVHETRQRNAELALINSVQEAIAGRARPAGDLRRRR